MEVISVPSAANKATCSSKFAVSTATSPNKTEVVLNSCSTDADNSAHCFNCSVTLSSNSIAPLPTIAAANAEYASCEVCENFSVSSEAFFTFFPY